MTKLTLGSHPFLLGFDQLERLVERTAKSGNDGYPPYNIEAKGENAFRITLAVAGFAEDAIIRHDRTSRAIWSRDFCPNFTSPK